MCSGTGDRTPKPLSNSPQGERATAALDYVNATPLELSGVRTSQHRSPIPAFPKGKEPHQTPLNTASRGSRPLGGMGRGLPWQLCRSCDYIAQGCGHGPLPWVMPPLILLLCKSCQGAPPQPSPRGGSAYMLCLRRFEWLLPLGEGWDGASMLDGTHLGTPTTFPRRTSPRR